MGVPPPGLCKTLVVLALLPLLLGCASYRGARLYQSGTEALEQGEVAVAIADLERAALLVAHASEIQNHLGLAYTEAGRFDAAYAAFRRAVDLDCGNSAAQRNLRDAQALQQTNSETSSASIAGARGATPEEEGP